MRKIVVIGGGASGLAAALAAAQAANGTAQITVLERNQKIGKKLLATGNGRCNLDNTGIAPEKYFSSDNAVLRKMLETVNSTDPLGWFASFGLITRTDDAGRIYPYSNQASDVLALLEAHLNILNVRVRTGCTFETLMQSRGGYIVKFQTDSGSESLYADAVICAMGGMAGPQFGTDGFGTQFAASCGGSTRALYPCLTPLKTQKADKRLAGIRAKGKATLFVADKPIAEETGEIQFTDYGLSGICIMQLSCLLTPDVLNKKPCIELDLFADVPENELAAMFINRAKHMIISGTPSNFWLGLLPAKLGQAVWGAAQLPTDKDVQTFKADALAKLAHIAKHWRFEKLAPCDWKQAQTTGGGLSLTELEADTFQFKGCQGLYFVGETLDCAGSCGGFNLHWAFGSGIVAGRAAASSKKHTRK